MRIQHYSKLIFTFNSIGDNIPKHFNLYTRYIQTDSKNMFLDRIYL